MTYARLISCVEPFLESIPQMILYTILFFSFWGKLTGNLDDVRNLIELSGGTTDPKTSAWVDLPTKFSISYSLSLVSAGLAITKFYKDGPLGFIPSTGSLDGMLTPAFILTLLGNLCFMVCIYFIFMLNYVLST